MYGFAPLGLVYGGVCDVQFNFNTYFDLLVNKCVELFKVEGLPETVDKRFMMTQLILTGKICFTKFDDKIYALNGNVGGEPNVYYEPQYFVIANPVLGSKQVKIRQKDGSDSVEGLDGIMVALSDTDALNDRAEQGGLYGLIYQTAGLLADNISSLNISQINGRVSLLFTADNEADARSGELILQEVYSGKPYKILKQNIIEKFGINPVAASGQNNTLMSLIEAHQYILAQFYNELGIAANYNMKRERLNTAEVEMNSGSLDLNIWNILSNLKDGIEKVNELFGTSITIELSPEIYREDSGNAGAEEENSSEGTAAEDKVKVEAVETNENENEVETEIKTETKEGEDE